MECQHYSNEKDSKLAQLEAEVDRLRAALQAQIDAGVRKADRRPMKVNECEQRQHMERNSSHLPNVLVCCCDASLWKCQVRFAIGGHRITLPGRPTAGKQRSTKRTP